MTPASLKTALDVTETCAQTACLCQVARTLTEQMVALNCRLLREVFLNRLRS